MKASCNKKGSIVYGLVDMLRIHIRYNEDNSLQDDLDRLFKEGNAEFEKEFLREKTKATMARGETNQSNAPPMT